MVAWRRFSWFVSALNGSTHGPRFIEVMRACPFSIAVAILAVSGLALGWNKGQLPHRSSPAADCPGSAQIAADLALYRDVIAGVRDGQDYYTVAREKIPEYGFPVSSPLNWRLPTYAW